jgi:polyisoprenoid-binding protein YceI
VKLRLADGSRVSVTVRSKGVLGALAHQPTFVATLESLELPDVDGERPIDFPVEARVSASAIEAPADASAFDRKQMIDNLRGAQVLDVARWPELTFRGRYRGTLEKGRLEGELLVRGAPRAIAWDVAVTKEGARLRARGVWEGTLTALGIKPFKAMLGALRLHDEARIGIDLVLDGGARSEPS